VQVDNPFNPLRVYKGREEKEDAFPGPKGGE